LHGELKKKMYDEGNKPTASTPDAFAGAKAGGSAGADAGSLAKEIIAGFEQVMGRYWK
jgi:hypothetical protein